MFEKYAILYKVEDEKQRELNINRQKYVYQMLKDKGICNTYLVELLDMIREDVSVQYQFKQGIETKAGFVIALFGVLLGILFQHDTPHKLFNVIKTSNNTIIEKSFYGIMLVLLGCVGFALVYYIYKAMSIQNYSKCKYDDKELNYKCAVEDKDMALVRFLEIYTNIWIKNESCNELKANYFQKANNLLLVFILIVTLTFLFV